MWPGDYRDMESGPLELSVPATPKPGTRVIGICGGFGAGKDTVAALLSMLGYQNTSYAAGVRGEVLWFLNQRNPIRPVGMPDELWVATQRLPYNLPSDTEHAKALHGYVYGKPTSGYIRHMLQWWGTDYRRKQDPDYWVKQLTLGPGKWTVSDVRFENEVNKIKELGGQIWRVESPRLRDEPGRDHESELAIAEIMPDVVLVNDGDIHKLAITVRTAMDV